MSDLTTPHDLAALLRRWLDAQPKCDLCGAPAIGFEFEFTEHFPVGPLWRCHKHLGNGWLPLWLESAQELAQAALDAIAVVRWEMDGNDYASAKIAPLWQLEAKRLETGPWAFAVRFGRCDWLLEGGHASSCNDAQRAAVAALRSLGVAVREEQP